MCSVRMIVVNKHKDVFLKIILDCKNLRIKMDLWIRNFYKFCLIVNKVFSCPKTLSTSIVFFNVLLFTLCIQIWSSG